MNADIIGFPAPCIAYTQLRPGKIARTIPAGGDSIQVDVDADGRVIGVETLDGSDWVQGLVRLAMEGRLAVVPKSATGEPASWPAVSQQASYIPVPGSARVLEQNTGTVVIHDSRQFRSHR